LFFNHSGILFFSSLNLFNAFSGDNGAPYRWKTVSQSPRHCKQFTSTSDWLLMEETKLSVTFIYESTGYFGLVIIGLVINGRNKTIFTRFLLPPFVKGD